jgi:carboxyl-terminal processing protease
MAFFRRNPAAPTGPRRGSFGPLGVGMALSLLLGFGLARGLQATDDLRSQLDLFSQILSLVQTNYVESPDNEKLIKGAIDGMLKSLDPHTVYLPPQRAQRLDEEFHGEYSGIGVQFDLRDNKIVVISPLEGTPAYRLGIRPGDRIVMVDGKPLAKGLVNDDVFKLLRGPTGSTVQVTIERDDQADPLVFNIERAKIPIESVPYAYMIRPGVGYVRIVRFAQTTGQELETSLAKLHEQGMKQLVVDLRSNGGGLLAEAVDVLDQLVPPGKLLVYTRGRIPSANADYRSDERPRVNNDVPVVVLIDHGSASASEIVAGAIQDLDRGLVVGTNSFGKGLVQNQFRLGDGSKLLLTIAHYYTPSGRLIQRDYSKFSDQKDYVEDAFKDDVPSDSVLATRPKFKTAAGRDVYGGGGIYPDVLIKDPTLLTRAEIDMINKRVFFLFGTHWVQKQPNRKWTPQSLDRSSFTLSDADWTQLRAVMTKEKVTLTDSLWKAEQPFMLRQVRGEVASEALGAQERYRILVEDDTQLQSALEMFAKASKLLMSSTLDESKRASHP